MNRLDIIEKKKKQLNKSLENEAKKLEKFKEIANNILLNDDTKDFFKLAFELYGQNIIDGLRKATDIGEEKRIYLLGKYDLLHEIIIPFFNYKQ